VASWSEFFGHRYRFTRLVQFNTRDDSRSPRHVTDFDFLLPPWRSDESSGISVVHGSFTESIVDDLWVRMTQCPLPSWPYLYACACEKQTAGRSQGSHLCAQNPAPPTATRAPKAQEASGHGHGLRGLRHCPVDVGLTKCSRRVLHYRPQAFCFVVPPCCSVPPARSTSLRMAAK
jgi:hypothetical protein